MPDRLRDLIDLVLSSLDEGIDGAELAERAHFSRDHLDRLLAAATGESPVALRRRLLLERAAWQLRAGVPPAEAASLAGYGSVAAFSRAFSRAFGAPPSAYAGEVHLPAPNGIHFHPPAGLLIPGGAPSGGDLTERMVLHHLDRVRELLQAAASLPADELQRELRPGLVVVWFEGEEPSAALMCERLVYTLEVWVAAIDGREVPVAGAGDWLPRFERAATDFARIAKRIRDRGAWDDAFVDALCEPPQSFTYGGVLSHVLAFGAARREALAGVLAQLGADVSSGDPIVWELSHSRHSSVRSGASAP
ncbi:helix-turn-helix transcriptional regulator [Solirubrobacter sp. CPCC 204708]|uniref:AraC family transcriptional regulator n=1 Tax=Solirubrobacter deserti TaxID=2282478 RepID=A0ABT4RLC2_9ACTN|nr:AraC family transcriptional regulator [Solirubrobacter deserti]MBE2320451.1 helix-turn-helix transcriptional regulator [Solirubrobacter deserti]MDA0139358.1 AraC family transcriptional regulator [Solirubrobacter deserti]